MGSTVENHKVKKQSLNFEQRLEILELLKNGEKAVNLSIEFNVSQSTISGIKKNENEILQRKKVLEESDCSLKSKKRFKGTEETELEKAVFKWVCETRHTRAPITGPVLQAVAREISNDMQENTNFKASKGWLFRFKSRHNLQIKNIHGEKLSANSYASDTFKNEFAGYLDMFETNLDCIYNCDETGLYWKMLPNKTYVLKSEKNAAGIKESKNRLTAMLCTNASGTHKIPSFMIGKSEKPRCFKNLKLSELPVKYASQKSAWMDKKLFIEWYSNCFVPAVKEKHNFENNPGLKIILLLDNAPCHPSADELEELYPFCSIIYLPPNVTSLIQPLDQGIIEKFKRSYKTILLKHLLIGKSAVGFEASIKSMQLTDCFNFCKEAWDTVTELNIRNCWKLLIPLDDNNAVLNNENEFSDFQSIQQLLSRLPDMESITLNQTKEWLEADKYEDCFSFSPEKENNFPSNQVAETTTEETEARVSLSDLSNATNIIQTFIRQNQSTKMSE